MPNRNWLRGSFFALQFARPQFGAEARELFVQIDNEGGVYAVHVAGIRLMVRYTLVLPRPRTRLAMNRIRNATKQIFAARAATPLAMPKPSHAATSAITKNNNV